MRVELLPVGSEELGYFAKRGAGNTTHMLDPPFDQIKQSFFQSRRSPPTPHYSATISKTESCLFQFCGEGSTLHTVVGIK